jgi:hypothetical protein
MADLTKYRPADLTTRKPKHDAGSEIDAFVQRSRAMQAATRPQRGRLIFALDATQSRQPTWDMACQLQAEMFQEVSNLDVQLVFYRGLGECKASGWVSSGERLANLMSGIICRTGQTQIGKILAHARSEIEKNKVEALVFCRRRHGGEPRRACRGRGRAGASWAQGLHGSKRATIPKSNPHSARSPN